MAKSIRTIKADLRRDETLGTCTRDARLLFVLLITACDDHGRFRASSALLRGELFPYDDDITRADVAGWLTELVNAGRVQLYTAAGQEYGALVNWAKHQRVDNASRSEIPAPPDHHEPDSPQFAADRRDSPTVPPVDNFSAAGEERRGKDDDRVNAESVDNPAPVDNHDDETFAAVIDALAAVKASRARPKNPTGYAARIRTNDRAEHGPRIRELIARYPGAPPSTLAAHILGEPCPTLAAYRRTGDPK